MRRAASHASPLTRLLAACLLALAASLPLQASADAFPDYPEATTDTDADGAPDWINLELAPMVFADPFGGSAFGSGWVYSSSWSVSGGYAKDTGFGGTLRRDFNVLAGGGLLTFDHKMLSGGGGSLVVNGITRMTIFTSTSWISESVLLSPGTNSVKWEGRCTGSMLLCATSTRLLDNVFLRTSSLTLDKFPSNAAAALDSDNDGFPDSWNPGCDAACQASSGLILDNCPINASADQLDTDGDGAGNVCDLDDDNDGVADNTDKFPLDPGEWLDADNDDIGNNADTDDDNDGVLDVSDNCPFYPSIDQEDDDGDGIGNGCDSDGPGKLVAAFNQGTGFSGGSISAIAAQPDGKMLVSGYFSAYNGVSRNYLARINADGALDTTFNAGNLINNVSSRLVVQADGKIVVVGGFASSANGVGRLLPDGSLDTGFNAGSFLLEPDDPIDTGVDIASGIQGGYAWLGDVVLQPDGKIVISGNFSFYNGTERRCIARLLPDGSLDAAFNPGVGACYPDGYTYSASVLSVQVNGQIAVGGYFPNYNGSVSKNLARIHTGDKDQDGIEDAGDWFDNAAAAIDTDRDGKPDTWLQSNPYSCVPADVSCNGLTLDEDDDNDGVPDSFDPAPLNPNGIWPLDGSYKGSAVKDGVQGPRGK